MKTSKLTDAALDWAVCKCEGEQPSRYAKYSTDWAAGGPIIEREGIAIYLYGNSEWNAHIGGKEYHGPTPLIAAMRCYVASRLGDEVDASSELLKV